MVKKDKRIDMYIDRAEPFARPILLRLRAVIHKACPNVEETIKWSSPHFQYGGKILCGMASFKHHCALGFRLGSLMRDPKGLMEQVGEKTGMGHFGRITSEKDLPAEKILIQYIQEAMVLTDTGVAKPKPKVSATIAVEVPAYFMKALKKDKHAYATFQNFSPSHKREYVEWITEAKTEETRNKRIGTAVEWLHQGKGRNWKYSK